MSSVDPGVPWGFIAYKVNDYMLVEQDFCNTNQPTDENGHIDNIQDFTIWWLDAPTWIDQPTERQKIDRLRAHYEKYIGALYELSELYKGIHHVVGSGVTSASIIPAHICETLGIDSTSQFDIGLKIQHTNHISRDLFLYVDARTASEVGTGMVSVLAVGRISLKDVMALEDCNEEDKADILSAWEEARQERRREGGDPDAGYVPEEDWVGEMRVLVSYLPEFWEDLGHADVHDWMSIGNPYPINGWPEEEHR